MCSSCVFRQPRAPLAIRWLATQTSARTGLGPDRFSIFELNKNRSWTILAGFDPKSSREDADRWERFRNIASQTYMGLSFDVSTPWNCQEPNKKREAYNTIASLAHADDDLRSYPGLQHHDLIAWRLSIFHRNQRLNLRKIVRENRSGKRSPFIPEIIDAMRRGEIRLHTLPDPHQLETLRNQRARIALSRGEKRQDSNELLWQGKRVDLKESPSNPEVDRAEVAQATSKRSEGAKRRWQRWREKIRSGEIPLFTRLRDEETRRKQSDAMKARLAQVKWTPAMREKKRRAGALGHEQRWAHLRGEEKVLNFVGSGVDASARSTSHDGGP
ncbi:MAG: hypothetical protein Q9162_003837 [Coniocarpon cinnabarinum]